MPPPPTSFFASLSVPLLLFVSALLSSPHTADSSSSSSSPASSYDTSMVHRLLSEREILIQDGLSYFNDTTLKVRNTSYKDKLQVQQGC